MAQKFLRIAALGLLFLFLVPQVQGALTCSWSQQTSGIEGQGFNGDGVSSSLASVGGSSYAVFGQYTPFSTNILGGKLLKNDGTGWSTSLNLIGGVTIPAHIGRLASIHPIAPNDIWAGFAGVRPGQLADAPFGPEMVVNGGFETYTTSPGLPNNWTQLGAATTNTRETTTVLDGVNAARVSIPWTTGNGVRGLRQDLPALTPGAVYHFSARFYLPSPLDSATTTTFPSVTDLTTGVSALVDGFWRQDGQWLESAGSWTAIAGHQYRVSLGAQRPSNNADVDDLIFDSVSVRQDLSARGYALAHFDGSTWTPVALGDLDSATRFQYDHDFPPGLISQGAAPGMASKCPINLQPRVYMAKPGREVLASFCGDPRIPSRVFQMFQRRGQFLTRSESPRLLGPGGLNEWDARQDTGRTSYTGLRSCRRDWNRPGDSSGRASIGAQARGLRHVRNQDVQVHSDLAADL